MSLLLLLGNQKFNPRTLFSNNEQGLWLDPSDMTAGKAAWRRNLLTNSQRFTLWTGGSSNVTANNETAPDSTLTASTINRPGGASYAILPSPAVTFLPNTAYTLTLYIKAGTQATAAFGVYSNGTGTFLSGTASVISGTASLSGTTLIQVTGLTSSWTRLQFTFTSASTGTSDVYFYPVTSGGAGNPTSGTNIIWGFQIELGSTPTDYQPITDFSTEFEAAYPTHTLYQDSTGVTPCTAAGDPVGLILDQSRGGLGALGSEVISNGTFDSNINGWTTVFATPAEFVWSSGKVAVTNATTNIGLQNATASTFVVGKFYLVEFDAALTSGSVLAIRMGVATSPGQSWGGGFTGTKFRAVLQCFQAGAIFVIQVSTGTTGTFDNISVREVPGNHAYQTTSASRPTLARIPSSGRRNLLTRTEELSNAAWGAFNVSNSTVLNGTVSLTTSEGFGYIRQTGSFSNAVDHTISFDASCDQTVANVPIRIGGDTSVSSLVSLTAGVTQRVTLTGYRPFGGGTPNIQIGLDARDGVVPGGSNSTGYTVTFNRVQLETGSTATSYQKVVATTDVTESGGVSDLWHLVFDGSDDSLVTNAVDFTATDEMTVIAGVRKLSDAARGTICELTATIASNNGAFHLTAPNAASATYAFESKGTSLTDAVASSVTAPITSVVSGASDISGDANVIRVNGTQSDSDTGDQGTGNYSNSAIFIGRRNQATLPYTGHIYQLIIRGKTTPTGKLLEAERFVARKTGTALVASAPPSGGDSAELAYHLVFYGDIRFEAIAFNVQQIITEVL